MLPNFLFNLSALVMSTNDSKNRCQDRITRRTFFPINIWEIAVLVLFCFFVLVPVLICIISVLESSVSWRCDKQLPDVSFSFCSSRDYLNVQHAICFLKVWLYKDLLWFLPVYCHNQWRGLLN